MQLAFTAALVFSLASGSDDPCRSGSLHGGLELESGDRTSGLVDCSAKRVLAVCNGPQTLRVMKGDGFAAFHPDEAGGIYGCDGGSGDAASNGIRFDPNGPLPEANVNCNTMVYVFTQAPSSVRQALSIHNAPHNACTCSEVNPRGECFYEPLCHAVDKAHLTCSDVTSDSGVVQVSPWQQRRVTTFTLPNFPGLSVELVQDAFADRLQQTYRFTNSNATAYALRIVRVIDGDLGYVDDGTATGSAIPSTSGYVRNISSFVPHGAEIHDNTVNGTVSAPAVSLEATAPQSPQIPGSDATFEGARLQGNGGSAHARVWWNYGVPITQLGMYGMDGDYWTTNWGTPAPLGESDQAIILQSLLTVPPQQTKTYVTLTKLR